MSVVVVVDVVADVDVVVGGVVAAGIGNEVATGEVGRE